MLYRIKIEPIYTVENLAGTIKEKVLEQHREINVDYEWYEHSYNLWEEKLKSLGYSAVKIQFSGFWAQGDGASFTARLDVEQYIRVHKLGNKFRALLNTAKQGDSAIIIERKPSLYVHENTIYASGETRANQENVQTQLDLLVKRITAEVRELSRKLYYELMNEYEVRTSDEFVLEALQANDYLFTEDGAIAA